MKIIGGEFKGRYMEMPRGVNIRPTSDKVREALFNIIKDRIAGASVLDLFAGSGSVGFEAISRGAASVTFVDSERRCVGSIKKTLKSIEKDRSINANVYCSDAFKAIKKLNDSNYRFNIIFLDPPYHPDTLKKCLLCISNYDILSSPYLIVCEHFKKDVIPEDVEGFKRCHQARYGDTMLSFYTGSK